MRLPSKSSIDTAILLRALAIASVVFNHSHLTPESRTFPMGYGGGMIFLLMLTGFNQARFSVWNGNPEALRAAVLSLAFKLFVPSLALVILSTMLFGVRYRILELLFVSNWFTARNPRLLNLWYPEVVVQMMLGLWLLFRVPHVAETIIAHPLRSALALFLVALGIRAAMPHIWDTTALKDQLPHLLLWDLFLGWVTFFAARAPFVARWFGNLLLPIGCAVLGAFVACDPSLLAFWWLVAGTGLLVLVPRIALPPVVARLVRVLSQATFTIFLLHHLVLEVYRKFHLPDHPYPRWLFALVGSAAVWVVATSCVRAYRTLGGRPVLKWGDLKLRNLALTSFGRGPVGG